MRTSDVAETSSTRGEPPGSPAGRWWFRPVIAPALKDRRLAVWISVGLLAQLTAGFLAWPGMPCPMLNALGFPCPGCGGTRAVVALLRGRVLSALTLHAWCPVFLAAVAMFVLSAVLPSASRDRFTGWVERVERRSGIVNLLLAGILLYWIGRLAYDLPALVKLLS